MNLFEFCIRRPVFATVLSLVLILLGVVSYSRLTVREYPNVDEPVVSVSTSYPGASATIIEGQITQVLEGSIAGIPGIDVLESTSRAETSRITIRFNSDVDPDVRDRGWVIVGGMTFGTLLTLFVIPTVCSFLGQVHTPHRTTEAADPAPSPAE